MCVHSELNVTENSIPTHPYIYIVTLSGDSEQTFRGFFVQCRLVADDDMRVGTFANTQDNTRLSSCPTNTVSCRQYPNFKYCQIIDKVCELGVVRIVVSRASFPRVDKRELFRL